LFIFEIDLSSTDLNLNLSIASDALDTSSLKRFLYLNIKNESSALTAA